MAIGGGFEIVMAADLVVAAPEAKFWLPETGLGFLPDAASVRLPRMLPQVIANEVLYAGRRLDAAEAARWGLINEVADDVMGAARAMAERVVASAPLSIGAIRQIRDKTSHLSVTEAFELLRSGTLDKYEAVLTSEDAAEGPAAFAEGRDPQWKGR